MYVNLNANQAGQITTLDLGLITYPGGFNHLSILLMAASGVSMAAGDKFAYAAGNDSLVIPVSFSNFNPGIYQNTIPGPFATSVTDVLNIGSVPEPAALALIGLGLAGFCMRKQSENLPLVKVSIHTNK